jgi:hypothetical protein
MALFGGNRSTDLIPGRAKVVPFSTSWNEGDGEHGGNANNWSANAKAKTRVLLTGVTASDGGTIAAGHHEMWQPIHNWVRFVFHFSGSNEEPCSRLPAELEVPVLIDRTTRQIVRIDEDAVAIELADYREVGRREFLEREAVLAPVRGIIAMPKLAAKMARRVVPEFRDLVNDIKSIGDPGTGPVEEVPMDPKELEQLRRTSIGMGHMHQRDPKALARARSSALQAGPVMAQTVAARRQTVSSFEAWLMMQTLSHAISEEEAAQYRRDAGLPRGAESAPPAA